MRLDKAQAKQARAGRDLFLAESEIADTLTNGPVTSENPPEDL